LKKNTKNAEGLKMGPIGQKIERIEEERGGGEEQGRQRWRERRSRRRRETRSRWSRWSRRRVRRRTLLRHSFLRRPFAGPIIEHRNRTLRLLDTW